MAQRSRRASGVESHFGMSASRRAFSLVDLLATLALAAIVLVLLLPGLQSARAASRRNICAGQLKQIALAAAEYAVAQRVFPPGCVSATVPGTNGWNRPSLPDWSTDYTWAMLILPQLGEAGLYDLYNFQLPNSDPDNAAARSVPVLVYLCPDDEMQINEPRPWEPGYAAARDDDWRQWSRLRLNYAANYGNTGYAQQDLRGVTYQGGFFTNGRGLAPADIRDGLGRTIAFGEVLPVHGPRYGGPPGDGLIAEGGQAFEGYLTPNSSAPDVVTNLCASQRIVPVPCVVDMDLEQQTIASRSPHAGGVHSALGDGSVRFVHDAIDAAVWRALCSSAGGEPLAEPNSP